MTAAAKILVPLALVVLFGGCNLSEPAGNFEFQGPFIVIWTDAARPPDAGGPDGGGPDLPPPAPPELVITEVLIETTYNQTGIGELGEYVEIKNVGEGPADPRNISLVIVDPSMPNGVSTRIQVGRPSTPEEVQVVSALQPIRPGEYFVFVRYELADALIGPETGAGLFYDYGRYASGPSLPNDADRVLELRYTSGLDIQTFDAIRWRAGEILPLEGDGPGLLYPENVAIGVRKDAEDSESNDSPDNWCLSGVSIGDGPVRGTPGSVSQCE